MAILETCVIGSYENNTALEAPYSLRGVAWRGAVLCQAPVNSSPLVGWVDYDSARAQLDRPRREASHRRRQADGQAGNC